MAPMRVLTHLPPHHSCTEHHTKESMMRMTSVKTWRQIRGVMRRGGK